MTEWKKVKIGKLLTESRIESNSPSIEKRIKVRLKMKGVEQRPIKNEKEGATRQYKRMTGQFIYGKQNLHKGAFGIVPKELDGFESSSDIPSFDVSKDCFPEWIVYFLKADNFYLSLEKLAKGVGSKRIHPRQLYDLEISLPPKDIQGKIISKINAFEINKNIITANIAKQKEYIQKIRQAILQDAMEDADKIVLLDEICDFFKGDSPIQKTDPGKYPLVVTGESRRTSAKFQFDTKAVCIPLVSSTGHGKKSLNYVHYQEGKFALGNILVALVPKKENILNAKFLHQYLLTNKDLILVGLMKGMANVTLPIRDLKKVEIALPSIRKQNKVETLMQKLDKLETEISQNQKIADQLMQAVLKEAFRQ